MKKKNFFILLITIVLLLTSSYIFIEFKSIFIKNSGILISETNLNLIKNNVASINNTSKENISIYNLFGNKRFIGLTLLNSNKKGFSSANFAIFDVNKKKQITYLEDNDNYINLTNMIYAGHIDNNSFVIIDNNSNVYVVDFESYKSYTINLLGKADVSKDDIKDIIISNNTVYILSRDFKNEYNETPFNNAIITKINSSNNEKKSNIEKISSEEYLIPVRLVIDSDKNVACVTINTVSVDAKYVETYSTYEDSVYLNMLPSENNSYKFFDKDTYKIIYLDNGEEMINPLHITSYQTPFLNKIISNYSFNSEIINGVPIYIDSINNNILYSSEEVYKAIHFNNPTSKNLIYKVNDSEEDKDYGVYEMSFLSFVSTNDRDVIGYLNTNLGTVIINKDGSYSRLTLKDIGFKYKKSTIYHSDNKIVYAKTV